jgi:hypothetical protein
MDRSDAGTLALELLQRQHGAALLLFALAMTGARSRARMLCIRFTAPLHPHGSRRSSLASDRQYSRDAEGCPTLLAFCATGEFDFGNLSVISLLQLRILSL